MLAIMIQVSDFGHQCKHVVGKKIKTSTLGLVFLNVCLLLGESRGCMVIIYSWHEILTKVKIVGTSLGDL